jgi:hypothetical protein
LTAPTTLGDSSVSEDAFFVTISKDVLVGAPGGGPEKFLTSSLAFDVGTQNLNIASAGAGVVSINNPATVSNAGGGVQLYGDVRLINDARIGGVAGAVGFYNTTPVAKQTVTGSRDANPALADLLTKLAAIGLIIDGTSV